MDYVTIESLDGLSKGAILTDGSVTVFSVYDEDNDSYSTKKVSIEDFKNCLFMPEDKSRTDLGNITYTAEQINEITTELSKNINNIITNITNKTTNLGTDLSNHISNKNNPHSTTKAQVGLGDVQNYGIATKAEAQAAEIDNKYMTPAKVKDFLNKNGITLDNTGDVILKIQSTEPTKVAGKTIIWIKA